MAQSQGADLARLHWRRQLELTVAGIAVGLVAFRLLTISIEREANVRRVTLVDGRTIRDASYLTTLWPAALGLVALAVLTAVVLVHVYRVAAFTFRSRGDHEPNDVAS